MKVKDLMTKSPACCLAKDSLRDIAQRMVECDCGMIPIVDDDGKAIGAVTDRDIVCRAIAKDRNPLELTAGDVMTSPAITVHPDADLKEFIHLLEERKIRRVLVADDDGRCVGIVSQADLVRGSSDEAIAHVLREVSTPTDTAAQPS